MKTRMFVLSLLVLAAVFLLFGVGVVVRIGGYVSHQNAAVPSSEERRETPLRQSGAVAPPQLREAPPRVSVVSILHNGRSGNTRLTEQQLRAFAAVGVSTSGFYPLVSEVR